jgi:hypothetical protein
MIVLIIGFCILLHVILTVNNTFCFATIDKVFYYVIVAKQKVLFTVNYDIHLCRFTIHCEF